jgi:hypothetical protein
MSEKKMVRRSVAIALGIVCILLIAVLTYFLIMGFSPSNSNLQNQVNDLTNTLNLGKSKTWANAQSLGQSADALSYDVFSPDYAGYVSVYLLDFEPTRTDSANIEVVWSSHGVNYDSGRVALAVGATAVFPVLPTSHLEVRVGNGYLFGNGANETVTITYYY